MSVLPASSSRPASVRITAALLAFLGITALAGGIEMVAFPHGNAYLPLDLIDGVPGIDTFLVPGLVLGLGVGVGALVALWGTWRRPHLRMLEVVEDGTGRHWAWTLTVALAVGFATWMALEWVWLGTPWGATTAGEAATTWVLYGIYDTTALALLVLPWTRSMRADLELVAPVAEDTGPGDLPIRVLVAWGGNRGGTAGLAEMVAVDLRAHGLHVDVRPAREVRHVDAYDAVVVGGALYAGRWHRDAARFVSRHLAALRARPVWLFSSGPLDGSAADHDIPPVRRVAAVMAQVGARGHVTFGGRLAPDATGFVASRMAPQHAGDWRDRVQVARWADHVAGAITWDHGGRAQAMAPDPHWPPTAAD